jgi:hypothetical protein
LVIHFSLFLNNIPLNEYTTIIYSSSNGPLDHVFAQDKSHVHKKNCISTFIVAFFHSRSKPEPTQMSILLYTSILPPNNEGWMLPDSPASSHSASNIVGDQ